MEFYEEIIFLDSQDSETCDKAFSILENDGEDALLEFLKQWHYPGEHHVSDVPPWGTSDDVYEFKTDEGAYILGVNSNFETISLQYRMNHGC